MTNAEQAAQALAAMRRAARHAAQLADECHLKVPVWRHGRIVHVDPKELLHHGG